ncbi:hypothetical protein ASPFODRAFT_43114 [Aspergillus luchuensis CBS 106.47]|uniref:Uncharacterized protein n=1 Tax=Aspergillus luchuensis (strain CBS 106.47) TaxID=1137211 RepID=A0A1M3TSX0_ASPLC|nr:hypothetical protein ASPFODRAFT_43114 [Aspergillus luchuensis CBS 106.47]
MPLAFPMMLPLPPSGLAAMRIRKPESTPIWDQPGKASFQDRKMNVYLTSMVMHRLRMM